jgi:hypothetical protein
MGRPLKPTASPRWPPPPLLAAVPLSLLPFEVAGWIFLVLCLAAIILAFRLLGVRDWRCIAVASLSWPTLWGIWLGNVSPLLLLGAAVAWRCRSHIRRLVFALAGVIAAKIFLWSLVLWLLVTRRARTAVATVGMAVMGVLVSWAVIGFAGMTAYPHMLVNVASIGEGRGSSLVAFLLALGVPINVSRAVALACSSAIFIAAYRAARLPDGDERSFGLAMLGALTATPIVWAHYLVLLYVPIALLSPTLSRLWFLPMFAIFAPVTATHPDVWTSLPELAIEAVILAWLCLPLVARPTPVQRLSARQSQAPQRISVQLKPGSVVGHRSPANAHMRAG